MAATPKVDYARLRVTDLLLKAEKFFTPDMKLTFIARHPTEVERYMIITADDLAGLIDVINHEQSRAKPNPQET